MSEQRRDEITEFIQGLTSTEARDLFNKLSMDHPIIFTGKRENQPPYPIDRPPVVKITKTGSFDSAHYNPMLEGKCQWMHGHTYNYRVTVQGVVDPHTGIAVDFRDLKKYCKRIIDEQLDHKVLNEILPFHPSAENIAIWIFKEINVTYDVVSIELWENNDSYVIVDKSCFITERKHYNEITDGITEAIARPIKQQSEPTVRHYREGYDG